MTMQDEVLTLVAFGYSNPQIATSLHLTEKQVKRKVRWLLEKYGAADKLEMAMMRWGTL